MLDRRSAVLVTLALALACAAAPALAKLSASAKLKPSGLGPLKVGMSEAEVERALGRSIRQHKLGPCGTAVIKQRRNGVDYLMFTNNVLRRATVSVSEYETAKGIRVGSPERAIKQAYAKAKRSPHVYDSNGSYFDVKYGNRSLRFETDGSKVTAMHGGRSREVSYVEGCA